MYIIYPLCSLSLFFAPSFFYTKVLSHCERISDSGINQLLDSPCGEILQVLELDNCPQITDSTLEKLRYSTQVIILFHFSKIAFFLRTCNTLKRVEVFDCQLLSRMAIQKLQVPAPLLKSASFCCI